MTSWTPEAVRELRGRLRLTQGQLAERVGCTRQAVYLWEQGKRKPLPVYAKRLDEIAQAEGDQS